MYFMWQIILRHSLFPKDEHFTKPDVEPSSPQINDEELINCSWYEVKFPKDDFSPRPDIDIPQINDEEYLNSSWYKAKLTWELIGYWMMMAF